MPLLLIAVVVGVAVRLIVHRGWGGPLGLSAPHPLVMAVPLLSLVAQVLAQQPSLSGARSALIVASHLAITAWAAALAWRAPPKVAVEAWGIVAGFALNALPIAVYGGMPVSAAALRAIGAADDLDVAQGHLGKHIGTASGFIADVLGDVIAIRPLTTVVSVGDLVVAASLCVLIIRYPSAIERATRLGSSDDDHDHGCAQGEDVDRTGRRGSEQ